MIATKTIDLIQHSLENMFDWSSDDLRDDFINFVVVKTKEVSREQAEKLFDEFNSIHPLIRSGINFDTAQFIRKTLQN